MSGKGILTLSFCRFDFNPNLSYFDWVMKTMFSQLIWKFPENVFVLEWLLVVFEWTAAVQNTEKYIKKGKHGSMIIKLREKTKDCKRYVCSRFLSHPHPRNISSILYFFIYVRNKKDFMRTNKVASMWKWGLRMKSCVSSTLNPFQFSLGIVSNSSHIFSVENI